MVPAPYDTVWCRFPYAEEPDKPAPKARPSLVRQAFADQNGNPWVVVVYGTSVDPYRGGDENFCVAKIPDMNMCGIKCATRFCLDRSAELPYSSEFFYPAPGKTTPILGHLSEYGQRLLQVQVSYMTRGA